MAEEAVVWIIDSEQWPRACLRAELIERGYEAVGFISIVHALAVMGLPYSQKPCIIVLELCALASNREELDWLIRTGIPIVLLGGAVELNERFVNEHEWTAVLRRPFSLGAVADKIDEFLKSKKLGRATHA